MSQGFRPPGIWPPPPRGEIPSDLALPGARSLRNSPPFRDLTPLKFRDFPPPPPFSKFLSLIYYWGQKQRGKDRPFRYMHQLFEMNNWKLSKKGFLDVLCLSPRAVVMFILKFSDTMLCRFNISSILFHRRVTCSQFQKRCIISSFCILQNEQFSLSLILILYK